MRSVRSSLITNRNYYQISRNRPVQKTRYRMEYENIKHRLYDIGRIYISIFRPRNIYNDIKKISSFYLLLPGY